MTKKGSKSEIRISHIMGGLRETVKTGEYPDYYLIRSRKYGKSWRVKELPVELKLKGEIVYTIVDELSIRDKEGKPVEDVEFVLEMRN